MHYILMMGAYALFLQVFHMWFRYKHEILCDGTLKTYVDVG